MRCKLCETQVERPRYRLDGFAVLACPGCGLVFTDPEPTREELRRNYTLAYFQEREEYYFRNVVADPTGRREDGQIADFKQWLDRLESLKGKGRLLDVGCGVGIFLAMAQERGWDAHGVDISEAAVQIARRRPGVKAVAGTLAEARFPDRSFDVITLLDVFEHFPDPAVELREIARVLKEDGLLLLNTPNQDALLRHIAHALHRLSFGLWTYPLRKLFHRYHLYYYSLDTLRATLRTQRFAITHWEFKPIPVVKARGSRLEKAIVRAVSTLERLLHMEYELVVVARRT
jgi:2-polyprenyl-3-methyl-5-hydroxy-6-metoxy-1,4-benzoquinol methylase